MDREEHFTELGRLVSNFQSLECILRAFLQGLPTAMPFGLPEGTDIYLSNVDEELPENEFTNYDSLSILIKRFNQKMEELGKEKLDTSLVEIRDALAHGRVSASDPSDLLRLIKFSPPKDGKVKVTFNQVMSKDWFKEQQDRTYTAIMAVKNAIS